MEESSRAKTRSIRPAVSIEHRLVTDRQTYRHRAIASSRERLAVVGVYIAPALSSWAGLARGVWHVPVCDRIFAPIRKLPLVTGENMSTIAISVAADVWGPASHIWLAGCGTCVYVSGYLAPYICPLDRFSYGWNMSTIGISGLSLIHISEPTRPY